MSRNESDIVVNFPAIPIEADPAAGDYKCRAQLAQKAWFANPTSLAKKSAYSLALMDWAKEVNNKNAQEHAEKLMKEIGNDR